MEGDAPTSGQTAEELPANHARLAQELVDVQEALLPFASTRSRKSSTAASVARSVLNGGRSIQ